MFYFIEKTPKLQILEIMYKQKKNQLKELQTNLQHSNSIECITYMMMML